MKNPARTLLAALVLSTSALVAQAETAVKVAVVDLGKLLNSHYKTEEANVKFAADQQKAEENLDQLNKEFNALVEQYKEYAEQVNNPTSTDEAKKKAEESANAKMEEINRKRQEGQKFQADTQKYFQTRLNNFKQVMIEDISKLSTEVAKRRGATLLFDKSGPTFMGVPSIIFADASFDITDEVLVEINKTKPAPVAAPAAPAAAPAPASTTTTAPAEPVITVPGAKK